MGDRTSRSRGSLNGPRSLSIAANPFQDVKSFPATRPFDQYGAGMDDSRPELVLIEMGSMRGLEIGPLANPRVRRAQGSITYLDHASTAALKEKYATNTQLADLIDAIVDVDIVQRPDQTLAEAVGTRDQFDYVIAAHVFEHIPDVIDWLSQIEAVLVTGGILSLVIPDKRFTFDINRRTTEVGEVLDAYLRNMKSPTFAQMFDFFAHTVTIDGMVDAPGIWAGTADYTGVVRDDVPDSDAAAFGFCRDQQRSPSFVDVHCHVFTPVSFLDIFEMLVKLDLTNFEIGAFFDTQVNTFEFHVSLRKASVDHGRDRLRDQQYASIRAARNEIAVASNGGPEQPAGGDTGGGHLVVEVSRLEERALHLKRRVLHRVRHRRPLGG